MEFENADVYHIKKQIQEHEFYLEKTNDFEEAKRHELAIRYLKEDLEMVQNA